MSLIPVAVIAFSSTSAVVTELLQWFFVWRTPGFQALKANLLKHGKAVDDAKDPSASKNLKKKEQRLQTWRAEAGKQVASYNMKAAVVVSGRGGPPPTPPTPLAHQSVLLLPCLCSTASQRDCLAAMNSSTHPCSSIPPAC
jgi:hypothetical protein